MLRFFTLRKLSLLLLFSLNAFLGAIQGDGYLNSEEINTVKTHWEDYKYGSEMTGVPILLLPAIHYRESGLYSGWHSFKRNKTVRNTGGPFMLDCGGSGEEFTKRIRAYEKHVYNLYCGNAPKIPKVSDNFRFAALVAAHELKTKLRGKVWTWDAMADAAWGYNGRAAWCHQNESPYLWSDPKKGTKLISRYKNMKGEWIKYQDTRPGVLIIYKELYYMTNGKNWPNFLSTMKQTIPPSK